MRLVIVKETGKMEVDLIGESQAVDIKRSC